MLYIHIYPSNHYADNGQAQNVAYHLGHAIGFILATKCERDRDCKEGEVCKNKVCVTVSAGKSSKHGYAVPGNRKLLVFLDMAYYYPSRYPLSCLRRDV